MGGMRWDGTEGVGRWGKKGGGENITMGFITTSNKESLRSYLSTLPCLGFITTSNKVSLRSYLSTLPCLGFITTSNKESLRSYLSTLPCLTIASNVLRRYGCGLVISANQSIIPLINQSFKPLNLFTEQLFCRAMV